MALLIKQLTRFNGNKAIYRYNTVIIYRKKPFHLGGAVFYLYQSNGLDTFALKQRVWQKILYTVHFAAEAGMRSKY